MRGAAMDALVKLTISSVLSYPGATVEGVDLKWVVNQAHYTVVSLTTLSNRILGRGGVEVIR
jgi:thiamine pyrophosphokinase